MEFKLDIKINVMNDFDSVVGKRVSIKITKICFE